MCHHYFSHIFCMCLLAKSCSLMVKCSQWYQTVTPVLQPAQLPLQSAVHVGLTRLIFPGTLNCHTKHGQCNLPIVALVWIEFEFESLQKKKKKKNTSHTMKHLNQVSLPPKTRLQVWFQALYLTAVHTQHHGSDTHTHTHTHTHTQSFLKDTNHWWKIKIGTAATHYYDTKCSLGLSQR